MDDCIPETGQRLRTVKATVRYVGAGFAGWQIQPTQRTVQGEIERALATIARRPIRVTGAGRTDSGVHAIGQVCSFACPEACDLEALRRSLSRMLSPEIRFDRIEPAAPDFNARHAAVSKRYMYTLYQGAESDPLTAGFAWRVSRHTDFDRLAALCREIEGEHDFAGFESSGATAKKSTVRTLFSVHLAPGGVITPLDGAGLWHVEFHGSGFLYKMVRNLMGTMAEIARGVLPASAVADRLAAPGPYRGHTAPAHGLTLVEVLYPSAPDGPGAM
jgi:tRNA pseudouridine38-40 synthase